MSLLMAVVVCGIVLFNAYTPPNPQAIEEHAALTLEAFVATKASEGKWLYVGDLNEEFKESPTASTLQHCGGNEARMHQAGIGSRWASSREVDEVVSNLGR